MSIQDATYIMGLANFGMTLLILLLIIQINNRK